MSEVTDQWLKEIGFKWFEVERSEPHWLLWIGNAIAEHKSYGRTSSFEDFGLELAKARKDDSTWTCWFRADYAGRYTRFIYCRDIWEQDQLIKLIEALTGFEFSISNSLYGSYFRPEQAERFRKQDAERFDRVIAFGNPWRDDEKDDTKAVRK